MENEALLRVIMASLQNHPQKTTWFFWGRGGIGGGFISLRFPLTWAAEVWVAMHETGSFKLRVGQFSEFSCFRLPEISFTVDHQYLFWRWTKLLLGLSSRRKIKPAKGRPSGFFHARVKDCWELGFFRLEQPEDKQIEFMIFHWMSLDGSLLVQKRMCITLDLLVFSLTRTCCDFMHRWGASLKQESMMY